MTLIELSHLRDRSGEGGGAAAAEAAGVSGGASGRLIPDVFLLLCSGSEVASKTSLAASPDPVWRRDSSSAPLFPAAERRWLWPARDSPSRAERDGCGWGAGSASQLCKGQPIPRLL